MAHIIRENAGEKTKTISELFTNKIFEFTFVSIFADMTIHVRGEGKKYYSNKAGIKFSSWLRLEQETRNVG